MHTTLSGVLLIHAIADVLFLSTPVIRISSTGLIGLETFACHANASGGIVLLLIGL